MFLTVIHALRTRKRQCSPCLGVANAVVVHCSEKINRKIDRTILFHLWLPLLLALAEKYTLRSTVCNFVRYRSFVLRLCGNWGPYVCGCCRNHVAVAFASWDLSPHSWKRNDRQGHNKCTGETVLTPILSSTHPNFKQCQPHFEFKRCRGRHPCKQTPLPSKVA